MTAERAAGAARAQPPGPAQPRATYRLQLNAEFPFAAAAQIAPYLAALGVSHVYLSPVLQAAPGSTHGYDVVDHSRVSDELGGSAGHDALCRALGRAGLGQVVDVVPNHMAIAPENPWWWDVLENGPSSRFADRFDVDWDHPEPHLRERVLVPVLADHYGRVLEAGELRLEWDGRRFTIRYHEHRLPVAPRSLDELLARAAERARSDELAWLGDAFGSLPPSWVTDRPSIERRHRDKEFLAARLAELATRPDVAEALEAVVAATNADVDILDRLLERQNYRLAWWRSARRDLGYRRFFDVTTLAGLRTEDERVFEDTHALILAWLADGVVDGLRIDHPDGLRDPESYFRRLRWASPRAWIVAEKILEPGEELRRSWPIAGTTGYDFLDRVQRLFLDADGEQALTDLHTRLTGDDRPYEQIVRDGKRLVLRDVLGSELGRLTGLLLDVLEGHRRHRDHTRHDLHEALRALLAVFPVYRTYVRPVTEPGGSPSVAPEDEAVVRTAIAAAQDARPDLPGDLFEVIADLLLLRLAGDLEAEFVARFQQLTGPVMAKGVEDTALYRYLRLTALNEVGADPGHWTEPGAAGVAAFHEAQEATRERWPETMLTTSTHDTKRSEDVRARLLVLSEVAGPWRAAVERWHELSAGHRTGDVPDGHAEYLTYQTVVGTWPIGEARLTGYLTKALREAKLRTSWAEPDEAYETGALAFARGLLTDPALAAEIGEFVGSILVPGRTNALAQTLVKLTAPGVPDLYQGSELWDLSLVDPDNRRPVDFALRRRLLASLDACTPEELADRLADPDDPGLPKLLVVHRALAVRARRRDAFGARGIYRPLAATGAAHTHVVAFARGDEVAVVVPRLTVRLSEAGGWRDTAVALPAGRWTNVVTGDEVSDADASGGGAPVAELLARFPVALLERVR